MAFRFAIADVRASPYALTLNTRCPIELLPVAIIEYKTSKN